MKELENLEGFKYSIMLGGVRHGAFMCLPANINQILIMRDEVQTIFCREDILTDCFEESKYGDIYTKYNKEIMTKDNYQIELWYFGFQIGDQSMLDEMYVNMNKNFELKNFIENFCEAAENEFYYH